ncbi:MAG: site-specific DNA-methyltransferase [Melioribacteraceae bacterium]|nr:site-specific DNA-methyltransferase [Melioribacteraceae bacterium]
MDGQSLDILSEKLSKLKEFYPEAFTEDQIDWEKLQATLGNQINLSQERYHLNWAGKSEVFRILQQRTSATLIPVPEESYPIQPSICHSESTMNRGEESQNIFIEGENLEVLKVLQKSYFGKIKMIYIDPPYNTGSDSFIYPDRFAESKDEYLKRIGDKDEEGLLLKEGMFRKNSKDSGHYHSNWLSMMYPRLYLARNLLRDDGVIFVSIDDNEVHNLRMIMNEIFGEENFVASIIWQKKYSPQNDARWLSDNHDFVLLYGKNKEIWRPFLLERTEEMDKRYSNPDHDSKGPWKLITLHAKSGKGTHFEYSFKNGYVWRPPSGTYPRFSLDTLKRYEEENKIWFGKDGKSVPAVKNYLSEVKQGITPLTIWMHKEVGHNHEAKEDIKKLLESNPFDSPKPVKLLKKILAISSSDNDLVLDFFAGSGTTAQAVMELNKEDGGNRKFILVQLPEKTDEASEAYKANYKTIADICKERIRRVIKKLNTPASVSPSLFKEGEQKGVVGFDVFKLAPSNFKIWRSDVIENTEDLEKMMNIFDDQVKPNAEKENMLYELILKSGYQLTVETAYLSADRHDMPSKEGGYYSINNNETIILLEVIDQALIEEILKLKPKNVIALDNLFVGNDQLKTNTVLQMKDANIEFRTV